MNCILANIEYLNDYDLKQVLSVVVFFKHGFVASEHIVVV
jgi:hypothetical protein